MQTGNLQTRISNSYNILIFHGIYMKFSTLIGNYINNPKIQKTFRKKITERLPFWIFVLHFTKY